MASSSNLKSGGSSVDSNDDVNPLWRYVTKLARVGEGAGGNCKWICSFCNEEKQGSYTRVKAHLFKITGKGISVCKKVGNESIVEMKKMDEEAIQRALDSKPKKVSLPSGTTSEQMTFNVAKRKKPESPLVRAFDMHARDQLDAEIARMFYTGGLSFNFARNPYYVSSYSLAANSSLGGYIPPGYNKLRTTLLEQEKAHVERLLEPIKSTWSEKGVSIVSDGWSDPQRRPLINFMVVSDSGPMFIKAVDCSGEFKDKHFIAKLLKEVIEEVGYLKVVQVITDNARNCKAAGEIIEGMFPHIYWTPCVVHTLNLALKNICSAKNVESNQETYDLCSWINIVHGDAMVVKNFIMNHSMRLAMFNRFSTLKLLSVAETRFASIVVMLKRFKLLRRALEAMVLSDQWTEYREDDQGKAKFVRELILDEEWWEKISYIIAFTAPMYDMLRVCDTDRSCLHLVYEMWDSMIEKVKKIIYEHERKKLSDPCDFYDVVHDILVSRWAKNNTPLHCLAHSLNPRYYSEKWLMEGEDRSPPHMDGEVSTERIKCFRRIFPSEEERVKALDEFANFSLKTGPFGDPDSIGSRYDIEPRKWWACYGSGAPLLQRLAFKLLGQPTSSSCAERNWSTYSFIQSLTRNKLLPKRAEDLVFVHNNLRLLSRSTPKYFEEKTKMWDVGGDQFGNLEDVGALEFANLSLDEPELENVIFVEEDTIMGSNKEMENVS